MTRRVLIFGTFDGFHEGHRFVVEEAAKKGSELVVAVARDEHVRLLKKKEPKNNEHVRLERVAENQAVSQAYLSDKELGSYRILDLVKPDVIVLGYDQQELKGDLERWMKENGRSIPIEVLQFFPRD